MIEFVKKTIMGYKEVPYGYSDQECSHVILTKKEYEQQIQEISAAKQEALNEKYKAENEIHRIKSDARERIATVEITTAQKVTRLEEELAKEQEESSYQRNLNVTLLRISRERANADRKLKPKKQHTGYVVTYSAEKEYRYKINRQNFGCIMLWETVLQSPYSADFTEQQARKQIWEDLFVLCEDKTWKIGQLGINGRFDGKYDKMIEDPEWMMWYSQKNVLLMSETKLRLNFNQLYWEVIIQHTKPLGIVPPDMRARQN